MNVFSVDSRLFFSLEEAQNYACVKYPITNFESKFGGWLGWISTDKYVLILKIQIEGLDPIKKIVQDWIDRQGHMKCWYYPEIFHTLCDMLGIKKSKPDLLPERADFRQGCSKFEGELYDNS